MARPNPDLIAAIEKTILKLSKGAPYQWVHMGACNCGNLAQELTKLSKAEIHSYGYNDIEIGVTKFWSFVQQVDPNRFDDSENDWLRTYAPGFITSGKAF